jgi:hypothetical protein
MKSTTSPSHQQTGSALLTVVMMIGVMGVLTAGALSYTMSERRGNERNRLILRTKNMSENISAYGAEQIITKLYRIRSASPMAFMTGVNEVDLPPESILESTLATFNTGDTTMEVRAGLTTSTGLLFIDPATNPGNANAGLQVNTASVPIIAKATGYHSALGAFTAYSQQDLAVDFVPLFQFAVFYNMDLEVWPGANMTIAGPVHANGEIGARSAQGFTATISFLERVSTSKGFYADANRQGPWIQSSGTTQTGAGGDAPVYFQHTSTGTQTAIKSSANVWRDHKMGGGSETTTTQNNFKIFANTYYSLNLRTSAHGVTDLVLPAITAYSETDDPATLNVDERNNGREIIAPPDHKVWNDTDGDWDDTTDNPTMKEVKISRKAGLYIVVNPDDSPRDGIKPDGSSVTMLPRSYRCWLNTVNSDLTHTITEVILPGQPSYGYDNNGTPTDATDDFMYVNNLPNAFRTNTIIGHNQVLRTLQQSYAHVKRYNGTAWVATDATFLPNGAGYTTGSPTLASFTDGYFWDLRRAINNSGIGALGSSGSFRSGNNYTPRPIAKIDLDMTRLRMCVERTMSGTAGSYIATDTAATIYDPSTPAAGNWASSIYNASGTAAARNLGLGGTFSTFPTSTTRTAADPYRMYLAPTDPTLAATITLLATTPDLLAVGSGDLVNSSVAKPWFDGVTVYVHSVDAERREISSGAAVRIDSGVRLLNARGPVISLDAGTYPNRTGFTFCTNDAAYVIGHFNANGTINSTTTATGNGGYSARYPDTSSEELCAVMADAITLLSQPLYNSGTYRQESGWSDSLSAHRGNSTWSSSWASTQPSGTNGQEGKDTSFIPSAMPTGGSTAGTGSARTTKFDASTTEVSACLLVGIVPTNHNASELTDGPPATSGNGQASGGLHNFPRLLEIWGSANLYIRGSMVAMFESRVAMEPWNLRTYSAPARTWGLHQDLRSAGHDLPLEPILLGARRLGFKEITPTQYSTLKTTIEALPH